MSKSGGDFHSRIPMSPDTVSHTMVEFNPQIQRYEERWHDWQQEDPALVELRNRLLSIGGTEVVPTHERDSERLVKNGTQLTTTETIQWKMESSQCHRNAANLYRSEPSVTEIGTGWALSDDGLWRQHSWAMRGDELVETTVSREVYFGILLDKDDADAFIKQTVW